MDSETKKRNFQPLKTDEQYRTTLREIGELRRAFDHAVNPELYKHDPETVAASKQAVNELIEELEERRRDYERRNTNASLGFADGRYCRIA
ncbi:MAG: hypothetical protein EA357_10295 [Micavibrio sp.]|jgi:hypothetical protein|nr:MAG: hypothetical protein EA357_10295 [Micavibrio sp.]